jgi:hypothetical protein
MIHKRMFQGVMLLLLSGVTFAACGPTPSSTPQERYCVAQCECNKCTDTENASCRDDILNLADKAASADCKDPYDTYVTCLNTEGACRDGLFDTSDCYNEEVDLNHCIKPPPACSTVDNGICNEPPPAGDGSCEAGTDTKDCMVPECPTANDGYCDEPENGGTCADGTDPLDCPEEPCVACLNYAFDPSSGTLCDTSTTAFTALFDCACGVDCSASCGGTGDICDYGPLSSSCYTCVSSLCKTAYDMCAADVSP